MRGLAGFTLIELLVVMGILSLLMGMMMPMYGIVRKSSMKSRTQAIIKKTETALRLFKTDWGIYPYQQDYPDMSSGGLFTNRLHYQVGTDMADADRVKVVADMDAAGGKYAYACSVTNQWGGALFTEGTQPSPCTFRYSTAYVPFWNNFIAGSDVAGQPGQNYGVLIVLNQAAQEQARMAMVAGDINLRGPVICNSPTSVGQNMSNVSVLGSPQSSANPGMAVDYLQGDIEAAYLSGDAILDAWKRPLVYIGQNVTGMQGLGGGVLGFAVPCYDSRLMGLGSVGFDPTTGPGQGLLSGGRPMLLYGGRVRLSKVDAGDALGPPPSDATSFPDAQDLRHSDVRYYAGPGYETEFELWSAGDDGHFEYMRDDPANQDNVSALDYNRDL